LKFVRGSSGEVSEHLKKGSADLAVAPRFSESWDRLESWPLFTESYRLVTAKAHPLAKQGSAAVDDLKKERLICRPYCEDFERGITLLSTTGIELPVAHNAGSDADFVALLGAELGVGIAPESCLTSPDLALIEIDGFAMDRTVLAYAVAGRQRSMAASTLIKMLRAADWAQRGAGAKAA
jgi:DNA-binding transcriptional LysR family regulator